jgi:hypothetical protein
MAKKALDPKAKAKRQKKIAIGGFVLLLALLAYQGPKTMKLLNPSPPPQSTPLPAPVTPGAAPTPGPTGTPVSSASPIGADVLVVNADLSPVPLDGQLAVFTEFTSKDPFQQQVTSTTPVKESGATSTPTTTTTPAPSESSSDSFTPAPGSTTTGSTKPAPPPPTVATISVNGVAIAVTVKTDFPTDSPFFRLVSLTATTAKIGIAGGSLATGSPTVTLKKGKAVTLMNTADGTRYILVLVSMGDTTTPAAPTTSTTPPTTTAPATGTSTTPTTPTTPGG